MELLFYIAGAVAVIATLMVITRLNAVHALLYLIVSLLAVAVVFFTLGAPFVAALEVIIYAGAIMVLFVFVVMMLNLGRSAPSRRRSSWLTPGIWIGPALLALVLLARSCLRAATRGGSRRTWAPAVLEPKQVGHRAVRALSARRRTGLDAAAGGPGGRLSPRPPHTERKTEIQTWHRSRCEHGLILAGISVRAGAGRGAGAPEHDLHADVDRDHAQRRGPGLRRGRLRAGSSPTGRSCSSSSWPWRRRRLRWAWRWSAALSPLQDPGRGRDSAR